MKARAVLFDLGGVVLDSPLEAIDSYERENRITPGSINRLIAAAGEGGAWARHEKGHSTSLLSARPLSRNVPRPAT